jgi:hypothetical protein
MAKQYNSKGFRVCVVGKFCRHCGQHLPQPEVTEVQVKKTESGAIYGVI